jgi:hybrid cluster-associated redox disulfide protein
MSAAIASQSIVAAVMEKRPETVAVFVRHRMHCPGCVMSRFMTLAEAAETHGVDLRTLLAELGAAAAVGQKEVTR